MNECDSFWAKQLVNLGEKKERKKMKKTLSNIISRAAHATYDSGANFMFAYSYIKENNYFFNLFILNRILRRFNSEDWLDFWPRTNLVESRRQIFQSQNSNVQMLNIIFPRQHSCCLSFR